MKEISFDGAAIRYFGEFTMTNKQLLYRAEAAI